MFGSKNRTTFICAANQDAEEAFKKTVEIDRLIDMLREANPQEVRIYTVFLFFFFNFCLLENCMYPHFIADMVHDLGLKLIWTRPI